MSTLTALLKLESLLFWSCYFLLASIQPVEKGLHCPFWRVWKNRKGERMQDLSLYSPLIVSEDAAGCCCHSAVMTFKSERMVGLCMVECIMCE